MFVPLSFGSQIPLLRAIFHGLGTQNPKVQSLSKALPDKGLGFRVYGFRVIGFRIEGLGF